MTVTATYPLTHVLRTASCGIAKGHPTLLISPPQVSSNIRHTLSTSYRHPDLYTLYNYEGAPLNPARFPSRLFAMVHVYSCFSTLCCEAKLLFRMYRAYFTLAPLPCPALVSIAIQSHPLAQLLI